MMNTQKTNTTINNVALKEERAKYIRRHVSSRYNSDNSITVTVKDGYDNILGEETFTKDDIFDITQEKGEKIIDKKISKAKAEERRHNRSESFETFCKYVGAYAVGYTGGILAVKVIKKIVSLIKR